MILPSVIIPQSFVWRIKETSDTIKNVALQLLMEGEFLLPLYLYRFIRLDFVTINQ